MFVIGAKQLSTLGLQTFEGEMVFHVARYFNERYTMMGESAALETVRAAIVGAEVHGIRMKPDVCRFLNCMLVLGSGFDRDPKFSWAGAILSGPGQENAAQRISSVNRKMLELAPLWRPCTLRGLFGWLAEVERNCQRGAAGRTTMSTSLIAEHLLEEYPGITGCIGLSGLNTAVELSQTKARGCGIDSAEESLIHASLMLLLGAHFDTDPQFPWIRSAWRGVMGPHRDDHMIMVLRETVKRVQDAVMMHSIQEP